MLALFVMIAVLVVQGRAQYDDLEGSVIFEANDDSFIENYAQKQKSNTGHLKNGNVRGYPNSRYNSNTGTVSTSVNNGYPNSAESTYATRPEDLPNTNIRVLTTTHTEYPSSTHSRTTLTGYPTPTNTGILTTHKQYPTKTGIRTTHDEGPTNTGVLRIFAGTQTTKSVYPPKTGTHTSLNGYPSNTGTRTSIVYPSNTGPRTSLNGYISSSGTLTSIDGYPSNTGTRTSPNVYPGNSAIHTTSRRIYPNPDTGVDTSAEFYPVKGHTTVQGSGRTRVHTTGELELVPTNVGGYYSVLHSNTGRGGIEVSMDGDDCFNC